MAKEIQKKFKVPNSCNRFQDVIAFNYCALRNQMKPNHLNKNSRPFQLSLYFVLSSLKKVLRWIYKLPVYSVEIRFAQQSPPGDIAYPHDEHEWHPVRSIFSSINHWVEQASTGTYWSPDRFASIRHKIFIALSGLSHWWKHIDAEISFVTAFT